MHQRYLWIYVKPCVLIKVSRVALHPFPFSMVWLLESHCYIILLCWMLFILAATKLMWESNTGHFGIFWAFPCPRVHCLWGCQNSSCSVHNPLPEGSGSLPGQLQRISPAEIQHTGRECRQDFFFAIQSTQPSRNLGIKSPEYKCWNWL